MIVRVGRWMIHWYLFCGWGQLPFLGPLNRISQTSRWRIPSKKLLLLHSSGHGHGHDLTTDHLNLKLEIIMFQFILIHDLWLQKLSQKIDPFAVKLSFLYFNFKPQCLASFLCCEFWSWIMKVIWERQSKEISNHTNMSKLDFYFR